MKRVPKFELYPSRNGWFEREWRWRLVGANGEVIAAGEGYTRKPDCLRALRAIKRLAHEARVVTVKPR